MECELYLNKVFEKKLCYEMASPFTPVLQNYFDYIWSFAFPYKF